MRAFPRSLLRLLGSGLLMLGAHTTALAQAQCTISAGVITFGNFTGVQIQASASVDLTCTAGASGTRVNYSVSMAAGNSQGSTNFSQRFLKRSAIPADTLNYNLYLATVSPTAIWGDGGGGSVVWSGRTPPINAGNPQRVATTTVIGVIPAGTVPSAGTYADTILVTATWN